MSASQDIGGTDYLSELIKSVMASSENTPETERKSVPEKEKSYSPPPADLISSVLGNPELIAKLPTILSTVKPIIEMLGKSAGGESVPAISAHTEKKESHHDDRRAALLCAMKPYLSHDRQMTIDYIIKLSRLGDILKTL